MLGNPAKSTYVRLFAAQAHTGSPAGAFLLLGFWLQENFVVASTN